MNDVIIIGAGPAGSAAAQLLARQGLAVRLIDKATFPRDKTCGDGLTPRAVQMLAELNVLREVGARALRLTEATVHAPNGAAVTTRIPVGEDRPSFMLTVPRLELDDHLCRRAVEAGARLDDGVHVERVIEEGRSVVVSGRHRGGSYRATGRFAVIAVGANLRLLLNLGILRDVPPLTLAARTYYEGVSGLTDRFEFHFDGIPLPGYAWVFPLSPDAANIGVGVMPVRRGREGCPSAQKLLRQFCDSAAMRPMLHGARRLSPIKGFPLRTDFASAPTSFGARTLIAGEAAGLVNPVTGEGVDYALESGAIAARHLQAALAGKSSSASLVDRYDAALRDRFQRLFVFSERIRDWYLRGPILNHLVRVANKQDALRVLFTDIVLGNADAARATSLKTMAQILLTW